MRIPGSYEPNSIIKDIDLVSLNTIVLSTTQGLNGSERRNNRDGGRVKHNCQAKSYQKARLEA